MTSRTPPHGFAVLLLALHAGLAGAAWHDEHAGNDVRAHHVHLSGHSADNDVKRSLLLQERQACAKINTSLGNPVAASSTVPPIIDQQDVDIYYAAGRTATLTVGRHYQLNHDNCAIQAADSRTLRLFGHHVSESCAIDLIKRRANGLCLPPGEEGKPESPATSQGIDLSKVPPHLRNDAQRALAQIARRKRSASPKESLPATGEFRTIAGLKCRVHRHASLPLEKCIAHPDSSFPIPASSFHAGLPGLLLYMTIGDHTPTLTANEVNLDIGLSAEAFAVPPDIRARTKQR